MPNNGSTFGRRSVLTASTGVTVGCARQSENTVTTSTATDTPRVTPFASETPSTTPPPTDTSPGRSPDEYDIDGPDRADRRLDRNGEIEADAGVPVGRGHGRTRIAPRKTVLKRLTPSNRSTAVAATTDDSSVGSSRDGGFSTVGRKNSLVDWRPVGTSSLGVLATVGTNVVPLIGVFVFGWAVDALVVVYAAEFLVAIPFAGVKAVFAQVPPDYDELETPHEDSLLKEDDHGGVPVGPSELNRRRGSVEVVDWLPPVYPRNLAFARNWFGATIVFTVAFALTVGRVIDPVAAVADPLVAVSAVSVVVAHVAVIERRYFRTRRYETSSPRDLVSGPIGQALVVAAGLAVASGFGPSGVLVVFVGVKLLADWGSFDATTDSDDRQELPPVRVPDTTPTAEVRPDRRATLLAGLFRGTVSAWNVTPLLVVLWVALAGGWDGGLLVGLVVFLIVPALVVGLGTIKYYLTHGTLAYQRRGDRVVAYDRLTDTPQWEAAVGSFRSAERCDGRLADHVSDSRTIVASAFGEQYDYDLAHLRSADRAVEAFELPVTVDRDPIDRRVVAVVTAVIVGLVAGVVYTSLVYSPVLVMFAGVFGAPLTTVVLQLLWSRAYPTG